MVSGTESVEDLLLNFRQLRTLTALHMRTYRIQNEFILLAESISNQLFISTLTFVGVVLAFVNIVLIIQQVTTELIVLSVAVTTVIFLAFSLIYRNQVKGKRGYRLRFLENEQDRLRDGQNEYSVIRMTLDEDIVPSIERELNKGTIDQVRAKVLNERLASVRKWLDENEKKTHESFEEINQELAKLRDNASKR